MNILLVRPPRIKKAITLSDFMFSEPLGLEMIYGVIKDIHNVEIFDMVIETNFLNKKIKEFKPNLVGVTSLCIDVNMIKKLCKETKMVDKNIITFIGGTQTYLNPKAFEDDSIDYVFEYTNKRNLNLFFDLLRKGEDLDLIDGILSREKSYESNGKKSRNEYLLPDRESTRKYRDKYSYFGYRPAAIMEFGMGCSKLCEFCLRWRIEGGQEQL
ncbi:MAG: cobalamin-dependent protein, partial [Eubacteriales bacterium]